MEYVPWKFDVPNYMTTDISDILFKSLKTSIQSIGSQGLWLMAFFLAFGIVVTIISKFTSHSELVDKGVKRRSLNREIFKTDFARNRGDVIDDSVLHSEISYLSRHKFHQKHSALEIQSKVDNMDSDHLFHKNHLDLELRSMVDHADKQHSYHRKHSNLEIESKKDSLETNHAFHKKHMDLEVRARVDSMEVGHAAEMLFNKENPDAASEKKDLYLDNADKYYSKKEEEAI